MELELRLPAGERHSVLTGLESLPGVTVRTINSAEEA
jgi:hypothetical protein